MENFGSYIKQKRKDLNYTQTILAEKIGCSQSYITCIENNEIVPNYLDICCLCNVLFMGKTPYEIVEVYFNDNEAVFEKKSMAKIKNILELIKNEPSVFEDKFKIEIKKDNEDKYKHLFTFKIDEKKYLINKDFKLISGKKYLVEYNDIEMVSTVLIDDKYLVLLEKYGNEINNTIVDFKSKFSIVGKVVGEL